MKYDFNPETFKVFTQIGIMSVVAYETFLVGEDRKANVWMLTKVIEHLPKLQPVVQGSGRHSRFDELLDHPDSERAGGKKPVLTLPLDRQRFTLSRRRRRSMSRQPRGKALLV